MANFKVGDRVRVNVNSYFNSPHDKEIKDFQDGIIRGISSNSYAIEFDTATRQFLHGSVGGYLPKPIPSGKGGWFGYDDLEFETLASVKKIETEVTYEISVDGAFTKSQVVAIINQLQNAIGE